MNANLERVEHETGTSHHKRSRWGRRLPLLFANVRRVAGRRVLAADWDRMVWSCSVAAVATFVFCWLFPSAIDLSVFAWLMFLTSGPTATFLPSASEPILMAFGKLYPPLLIAVVGVSGITLVEWLNYRVFGAVMESDPMASVRSSRVTRVLSTSFATHPFLTTVVAAATPIPFWVARICAVVTQYSMSRFILATAIGRFPRLWFFAFLGTALPVNASAILLIGALIVLVSFGVAAARRHRSVSTAKALSSAGVHGRRTLHSRA